MSDEKTKRLTTSQSGELDETEAASVQAGTAAGRAVDIKRNTDSKAGDWIDPISLSTVVEKS